MSNQLKFTTAIITYPSDYDGQLSIGIILEYLEDNHKLNKCKAVIAREDPDGEIQRIHFHMYIDYKKQKQIRDTKYYDVPLRSPVVCFIKKDKTRFYQLYSELESSLGIENILSDMAPKLDEYAKQFGDVDKWEYLTHAHANIQLKQQWGDKYFMLKYVMKQNIVARSNFDVNTELKYLEDNCQLFIKRVQDLTNQTLFKELGINSVNELVELCKRYVNKLRNKKIKELRECRKFVQTQQKGLNENEYRLCSEIRRLMYENKGITKREVREFIMKDEELTFVYWSKYINYSKLLNDTFKSKPSSKPQRNYEFKFYIPNKLYEYIMWLDQWVMNWTTGNKDKCEHRPKGLVLIGKSRSGKTSLMSLIGDFSYFKNIWNSDNWEYLPPYTIMDDMDALDEGKGLSFSWYKPWFGAQDAITITDKFKPKEDITNGKPLIWLNNFKLTETFKSDSALDYIKRNMVYVDLGERDLFTEPKGMDVFEYKEFDPKTTWYYKNIINKKDNEPDNTDEESSDDSSDEECLSKRKKKLNNHNPRPTKKTKD